MVLFEDEFIKAFTESEIKKIHVSIRSVDVDIYLRRLSGYVKSSLRKKANQATQRGTLDAIIGVVNNSDYNFRDDDIELVDFFLLRKSICDAEGELIFKDEKKFETWLKNISGDVMDYIILEISKFNKLIDTESIEDANKEVKKK